MKLVQLLIILMSFSSLSVADSGLPTPRFVTIKSSKVNVRVGPGAHFPLKWVFVKSSLPVEIIAEYDTWRKIRDFEGADGWVHQNMLVGKRNVIIKKTSILVKKPSENGKTIAQINENAIAKLVACDEKWCQVKANDFQGWLLKENCWGVYKDEIIK